MGDGPNEYEMWRQDAGDFDRTVEQWLVRAFEAGDQAGFKRGFQDAERSDAAQLRYNAAEMEHKMAAAEWETEKTLLTERINDLVIAAMARPPIDNQQSRIQQLEKALGEMGAYVAGLRTYDEDPAAQRIVKRSLALLREGDGGQPSIDNGQLTVDSEEKTAGPECQRLGHDFTIENYQMVCRRCPNPGAPTNEGVTGGQGEGVSIRRSELIKMANRLGQSITWHGPIIEDVDDDVYSSTPEGRSANEERATCGKCGAEVIEAPAGVTVDVSAQRRPLGVAFESHPNDKGNSWEPPSSGILTGEQWAADAAAILAADARKHGPAFVASPNGKSVPPAIAGGQPAPEVKDGDTMADRQMRIIDALERIPSVGKLNLETNAVREVLEVLDAEFLGMAIDPPSYWSDGYRAAEVKAQEQLFWYIKNNAQLHLDYAWTVMNFESTVFASGYSLKWALERLAHARLGLAMTGQRDVPEPMVPFGRSGCEGRVTFLEAANVRLSRRLLAIAELCGWTPGYIDDREKFDIAEVAVEQVKAVVAKVGPPEGRTTNAPALIWDPADADEFERWTVRHGLQHADSPITIGAYRAARSQGWYARDAGLAIAPTDA